MKHIMELGSVPIGEEFKKWERTFTVLDHIDGGVFVLKRTIEKDMPFKEDNGEYPLNNFTNSDVREFLDGPYLDTLDAVGPWMNEVQPTAKQFLKPFDVDLKCTLGQHEYGVCEVMAGLLTLEQYGQYYDIIPPVDNPWWLATPWMTPSRSPCAYSNTYAWFVASDGSYGGDCCSSSYGVRPALLLNPSLLVSYGNESEGDVDLSNIPTERLAQELCRRAGGHSEEVPQ
jgi:hypothetical protein